MNQLENIVSDYIVNCRKSAEKELRWFALQRKLEDAISLAALAQGPAGKRFSHQHRIPRGVLAENRRRLLASTTAISQAKTFEELHEIVASAIKSIRGVGELTVYDTALRIGARLKLEPNVVFLHAGTRVGARLLNLNVSRGFVPVSELPQPLHKLRPREIEDLLCIYKAHLDGCSFTTNDSIASRCS